MCLCACVCGRDNSSHRVYDCVRITVLAHRSDYQPNKCVSTSLPTCLCRKEGAASGTSSNHCMFYQSSSKVGPTALICSNSCVNTWASVQNAQRSKNSPPLPSCIMKTTRTQYVCSRACDYSLSQYNIWVMLRALASYFTTCKAHNLLHPIHGL